jgi:spore coat polysaccharide biosynthesis predicted glycosyltransferase SpsG
VNVKKLRAKKNDMYDVVVVMGGVDRDRVSDRVLEQLTRKQHRSPGERTRFLITTVQGDLWAEGKTIIDAVSKATDDADAENIAKKIAAFVEKSLEKDVD